jgi:hypothetical protein
MSEVAAAQTLEAVLSNDNKVYQKNIDIYSKLNGGTVDGIKWYETTANNYGEINGATNTLYGYISMNSTLKIMNIQANDYLITSPSDGNFNVLTNIYFDVSKIPNFVDDAAASGLQLGRLYRVGNDLRIKT